MKSTFFYKLKMTNTCKCISILSNNDWELRKITPKSNNFEKFYDFQPPTSFNLNNSFLTPLNNISSTPSIPSIPSIQSFDYKTIKGL